MEEPLETTWVGLQTGLGRVSGNHKGGVNSDSQVDRDSDMALTWWLCGSVGGGLSKGWLQQWPLLALLSGRKLSLQPSP